MNEHTTASEAPNTQEEEKKGSIILGIILLFLAFGLFGLGAFWGIAFLGLWVPELGMNFIFTLLIIGVFVLSIVVLILALRQFYWRINYVCGR